MADMSIGTGSGWSQGGGASGTKQTQGTLVAARPFDPEADGKHLRKAMKGLGTDEKAIIDVIGHRSAEQRMQVLHTYKTMYGRDLIGDLKSELGGRFEDVVIAMMKPQYEYDAYQLKKSMKGLGTDEDALIEILCSRNNRDIQEIKAAYKKLYHKELEKDIISDTSGDFKKLMVSLANGHRSEAPVDQAKARKDAQELYEAGASRWGTDESQFNCIMAAQSMPQLQAVFKEYEILYHKTIEQVISSEMSGNLKIGMQNIASVVRNPQFYFAEKLYKSMKGMGTDDNTLIRIIVSRCEIDMVQIKQEFQNKYHQTLGQFIKDDCSGHYKKMLLALIGESYK